MKSIKALINGFFIVLCLVAVILGLLSGNKIAAVVAAICFVYNVKDAVRAAVKQANNK